MIIHNSFLLWCLWGTGAEMQRT